MSLPLMLVHGWGMNAACWDPLKQEVDGPTYAPDLPGFGQASGDTCPDNLDQLTKAVLTDCQEPAIWCGWSLGAMVAMRAALMAPDLVRGLLLIAATPKFIRGPDWNWGTDYSLLQRFALDMERDATAGLRRFVLLMFKGSNARRDGRRLQEQLAQRGPASDQAMQAGLRILAETDLRPDLAAIRQPVRLVAGTEDAICPPEAGRWLSQQYDWPLRELPGEGHAPQYANPGPVLEELEQLRLQARHAG